MNGKFVTTTNHQDPASSCLCFYVRKSARAITQLYDDALRPTGLRATQFTLLFATRKLGPVTVNCLAETLVMDRTTLTRNLRPLEKEGLVQVLPGGDRREREITLTAAGQATLSQALPVWRRVQAQVRHRLGPSRVSRLLKELARTVEVSRAG